MQEQVLITGGSLTAEHHDQHDIVAGPNTMTASRRVDSFVLEACEQGQVPGWRAHLASLSVATLALHLGLHQRVVGVAVHVADAAAQLRQAGPGVAVQLVEHLRAQATMLEQAHTVSKLTCPGKCASQLSE